MKAGVLTVLIAFLAVCVRRILRATSVRTPTIEASLDQDVTQQKVKPQSLSTALEKKLPIGIGIFIAVHVRRTCGAPRVLIEERKQPDVHQPLEQQVQDASFVPESSQRHLDQPQGEQKLAELTDRSRQFLENVSGFLKSKRLLDAITEEVLPQKWMELHPSFVENELMVQKNLQGNKVQTLDELLEVATIAKPIFDGILEKIVRASKLDPERTVTDRNGQRVMLDNSRAFTVLTLAPLKGTARLVEKVTNEYKDFSKVVDVVRCSVVVFTEAQLESVAQFLKRHERQASSSFGGEEEKTQPHSPQNREAYVVVRLKNRFKTPLFNGYRDALYNIVVQCGDGVTHVCEVQLHLADVVAHKEGTHVFYEYFRTYFSGSRAEESRMQALEKLDGAGGAGSVDQIIGSILSGSDLEQLGHLAHLIEDLMGDVKIAVLIRKRIVALDQRNIASHRKYGKALLKAGKLSEAEVVLRAVLSGSRQLLGDSHPSTLIAITTFASLLRDQGNLVEAEPLYQEVLRINQQVRGNSHPDTLHSIHDLALLFQDQGRLIEAESLYRTTLDALKHLGHSHLIPTLTNNLASLLKDQGRLSEAEPLFREALEGMRRRSGNSHPATLGLLNNLASLLEEQGELGEAEPLFREVLEGKRELLGNSHPDTLGSIGNLAVLLERQGERIEAESLLREATERSSQVLGNSHPTTLRSINNIAWLLEEQGMPMEASLREAFERSKELRGNSHFETLALMSNLAVLLHERGKLNEAEPLHREALSGMRRLLGDSHPKTLSFIDNLASLLKDQCKLDEAESLYREALSGMRGTSHPDTIRSIMCLAALLRDQGRLIEAEPLYREALSENGKHLGNSHPDTLASIHNLGSLLQCQGRLSEAEPLLREALDGRRRHLGNSHPDTLTSMNNLAASLRDQGKLSDAEPLFREALNASKQRGNSHPETLAVIGNFASLLFQQGKLSEAEPYFREALAGMRLNSPPRNTLMSINNLAVLLKAWGKLDEAEPLFREALAGRRQLLGGSHPETLTSIKNLASLLEQRGKRREAKSLFREAAHPA